MSLTLTQQNFGGEECDMRVRICDIFKQKIYNIQVNGMPLVVRRMSQQELIKQTDRRAYNFVNWDR